MKISPHAAPVTPRQVRLEQELEDSWGTYMYCEAADFQSAEERETSRQMSRRMGELSRELASLRGASVLCEPHVEAWVERLQEEQPLARVALPEVLPHLWTSRHSLTDEVAELQDALLYKTIDRQAFDAAVADQARPTTTADDPAVRAQTAELLREGVPRTGPDLFPNPAALVEAVRGNPEAGELNRVVADLVKEGELTVTAQDLAQGPWQCVYQDGDLGRWTERLEAADSPSRARNLKARMQTMLNHPGLAIPAEERREAEEALRSHT